jgi:hypothetical protein
MSVTGKPEIQGEFRQVRDAIGNLLKGATQTEPVKVSVDALPGLAPK